MKQIRLTQGKYAMVDDDLFDYLNQWKWHYMKGYATRRVYHGSKDNFEDIYMHRLINNTPEGLQTDHINRNKSDNQKINLRTVTSSQNKMNIGVRVDNSSGHRGVWFDKERGKWAAEIMVNKKKTHLGRFQFLDQAILAREKGEKKYHRINTLAFT